MIQQEEKVVMSTGDLILVQLRDLKESVKDLRGEIKETRKELNDRMDRIENRMDRLEERVDRLSNKIDSSANHGQIATISTVGIALAVIYSLLK